MARVLRRTPPNRRDRRTPRRKADDLVVTEPNMRRESLVTLDTVRGRTAERLRDQRDTRIEIMITTWGDQSDYPYIVTSGREMHACATEREALSVAEGYRQKWARGGYEELP